MIRAALFDLDETLLARRDSLLAFLWSQWDKELSVQTVGKAAFTERFLALDDNGRVWKDAVYAQMVAEFSLAVPADTLLSGYIQNFPRFARLFPGAREALLALRDKTIALGIISNGRHDFQMSVIDALGLRPLMDVILISESEKLRKPDPKIFHRALAKLGVSAGQAVFVGDNPIADIEGARTAGMKTLWFQTAAFSSPIDADGVFGDFRDLDRMISKLS